MEIMNYNHINMQSYFRDFLKYIPDSVIKYVKETLTLILIKKSREAYLLSKYISENL